MLQLQSAFGVVALLAIAWILGENRRAVSIRQAAIGLGVTLVTALVLIKVPLVAKAFAAINDAVSTIAAASRAGTSFVFGYLGGGTLPFDLKVSGADFILAFQALPIILVMTGGMAGIAGTVLVLYATLLAPLIPDAAAHFVIASVLGAPAAILVSLIMVPETSGKRTGGMLEEPDIHASSTMDAIVKGTTAGLELLLNIIAMLLVLVALVYLANAILGLLPEIGGAKISLQRLLGYLMAPVCWLLGLPWPQAITAGSLMGTKTVLNELIAYVEFSKLGADALDPRSRLIMLYAMCGFANFASLGIMIGGLGTMAPERREEINALGLKSIVSGTLATCLMGAIVGVMT